jgi:hypothetical protein
MTRKDTRMDKSQPTAAQELFDCGVALTDEEAERLLHLDPDSRTHAGVGRKAQLRAAWDG